MLSTSFKDWIWTSAPWTAFSAVVALISVFVVRGSIRDRIASERPYLILEQPGIKALPDSPPYRVRITLINQGVRPALDLVGRLFFIQQDFEGRPMQLSFSIANAIPSKSPTPYYNDSLQLGNEVPPMYIVLSVKYRDPLTNGSYPQQFFMKWGGVQNGKTHPDFVHTTLEEKSKISAALEEVYK